MGAVRWIALVLVGTGGAARADEPMSTDKMQGFVAPGTGELKGRVTDAQGNGVGNATVHIVTRHGDTTVKTKQDGTYAANVRDQATLLVVYGGAQISGSAVTSQVIGDLETIVLKDTVPPAKLAEPKTDPTIIPEYSDDMMDKNVWARAWLLLDVSETGAVSRVKLINPPGYGLDGIAVRDGFKLKFEPARDRTDKTVRTQVLWVFEWPAFWWMQENHYPRRKMPREAYRVPCYGTAPTRDVYRDCSSANLVKAITAKWIDRPKS